MSIFISCPITGAERQSKVDGYESKRSLTETHAETTLELKPEA